MALRKPGTTATVLMPRNWAVRSATAAVLRERKREQSPRRSFSPISAGRSCERDQPLARGVRSSKRCRPWPTSRTALSQSDRRATARTLPTQACGLGEEQAPPSVRSDFRKGGKGRGTIARLPRPLKRGHRRPTLSDFDNALTSGQSEQKCGPRSTALPDLSNLGALPGPASRYCFGAEEESEPAARRPVLRQCVTTSRTLAWRQPAVGRWGRSTRSRHRPR
jgi:hypothetical protein